MRWRRRATGAVPHCIYETALLGSVGVVGVCFARAEHVHRLDDTAGVDEALDRDARAGTQTPEVDFSDLYAGVGVALAVRRPSLDVAQPAFLAGDADAGSEARTHAAVGETLHRRVESPGLVCDQVADGHAAAAAFAGFAVHDDDFLGGVGGALHPSVHAAHDLGHEREGRRMVIGPWKVPDAIVDGVIGVAGAFGAELPDAPVGAVFRVEETYEGVEGIAIGEGGVGFAGTGGCDDCVRLERLSERVWFGHTVVGHVAEVEVGFGVGKSWAGHDTAENGCLGMLVVV